MNRKWTKLKKNKAFFCIFILLFLLADGAECSSASGLSGFLNIPHAYADAGFCYLHFNGASFMNWSKTVFLPNLELGIKKRENEGDGILSFKLQLLPETGMLPAAAVGILNYNDPDIEKSYFLSLSKTLSFLSARIHGGMIRAGRYKDAGLASVLFDQIAVAGHMTASGSHEDICFVGAEKSLFSMFDLLAGYSSNGIIDTGVRVRLSSLNLEWWQFDVRDKESYKQNRGYTVSIGYRF